MKKLALAALLLGAVGTGAFAADLCTDAVVTAADLQGLGATGCQFGDKTFTNFSYVYSIVGFNNVEPADVSASDVTVVFSYLNGNNLAPVLSLLGTWAVGADAATDIQVQYDVTAPVSNPMISSWLGLTAQVSDTDPDHYLGSYVHAGDTISPGVGPLYHIGVDVNPPTSSGLTSVTRTGGTVYSSATTSIHMIKDVYIYGGQGDNQVILTNIDQGLFETPEPMVSLMVGGGFMLLGLLGARNRRKRTK